MEEEGGRKGELEQYAFLENDVRTRGKVLSGQEPLSQGDATRPGRIKVERRAYNTGGEVGVAKLLGGNSLWNAILDTVSTTKGGKQTGREGID